MVNGDKAVLYTEPIDPTALSCFSFWYNMDGSGIGTLRVFVTWIDKQNVIDDAIQKYEVWTLSGDQGSGWKQGQVMYLRI